MTTEHAVFLLELASLWIGRLVVEAVLLWRRRRGAPSPKPKTISMVLRDARYYLTSHVYLTAGLLTHCFVPWRAATVAGSVVFWLIGVALFVWDLERRGKPVETWPQWVVIARDPPAWLLIGALSGLVLFPQGV